MLQRIIPVILFFFIGGQLFGQSELNAYFLKDVGASQYLNPANNQEAKLSWYLPNGYYIHGSEGPGFFNLIKDNVFNLENINDKIEENNSVLYGFQGSLGSLHLNYSNFSFHIGQNLKSFTQVDYNNLLFEVLLNGNAQFIGETINIGPYVNTTLYNEFYLGFGVKLQNLQLGARIKRLYGYANAYTPRHEFSLYTNDEIYQLDFNTEYHLYTNLAPDSLSFENPGFSDFFDFNQIAGNLINNKGWAFDFGLKADILDQFTISASLLDMGYINWKNGTTKITTQGNFEFEGLDLVELITDSLETSFEFDSLASIIDVQTSKESYRAGIPVKFYLGLQYYPTEQWEVNTVFYNSYSTGRSHPGLQIGAKYKPSQYFHTSVFYTWNRFAAFNLGVSAEAHLAWFHTFLVMDNLIDIIRPATGNYFNIRAGVQIDFIQ